MKLTFAADIAPDVMRNAMICMAQALDAERPLNELERLGWLVICKYIVDRWPAASLSGMCAPPSNISSSRPPVSRRGGRHGNNIGGG